MNNLRIDPRETIIKDRMIAVKNIWLVSGFKGGIGKSLISVAAALGLADNGRRVGLLDLDITSSTDHIILGADNLYPKEDMGLLPPEFEKIKFMSFHFFSKSYPLGFRGNSISNAIKELLCVTIWGELDFLIIDMPPGFSDTTMDVIRIFDKFSVIAISTPSPLSKKILENSVKVYKDMRIKILFVENMAQKAKINSIRFDPKIDKALGDVKKIKRTQFYKDVLKIVSKMESGGV
ncbi:MAG: P-loop NTPase [Elusimicrobiales bacterium]|nr:P-loop NTPase [Elusimicrobiales bacterium]